jgi:hypothetical protein
MRIVGRTARRRAAPEGSAKFVAAEAAEAEAAVGAVAEAGAGAGAEAGSAVEATYVAVVAIVCAASAVGSTIDS